MADSSPWKGRSTDTTPRACLPAPLQLRAGGARPPRPPALPARSPCTKFVSSEGPEPPRAFWKGSGTEEDARAVRAREYMVPGASAAHLEDIGAGSAEPSSF